MSDTPRTDVAEWRTGLANLRVVHADFARELERELAALVAERDALRKERDEAHGLIRAWSSAIVDVEELDGAAYGKVPSSAPFSYSYAMTDADTRAFLAATRKQGGGA